MAIDSQSYFKFLMAEDLNLEGLTSAQLLNRIETLEKAHVGEDVLASSLDSQCDTGISSPVNKLFDQENVSCKHCGYPHQSVFCKFKHLSCRKCGRKGHLEKVCFAKQSAVPQRSTREFSRSKFKKSSVKTVSHESEEDEDPGTSQEDSHLLKV